MAMTKKDFIALADVMKLIQLGTQALPESPRRDLIIINALCAFMREQNPRFNEQRWRDYLAGKCGPSGKKV